MDENKENAQASPQFEVDEHVVQAKIQAMKDEQNMGSGLIGGVVGGLLGAMVWALVTYLTEYQIGWMAVGVGFLVGLGIRSMGRGIDRIFGAAGGIIALGSVILGNFLASLAFLGKVTGLPLHQVMFRFDYGMTFTLMKETFSVMDVLFYGLAVYAGYRYSFRRISKEELLEGAIRPAVPK